VFSLAVMTSVELPLIIIDMWPGIYIYIACKDDSEGEIT
jgi:hypothetical protein